MGGGGGEAQGVQYIKQHSNKRGETFFTKGAAMMRTQNAFFWNLTFKAHLGLTYFFSCFDIYDFELTL